MNSLTPADLGILAATLDDAWAEGLGDDDTVQRLAGAALHHGMAKDDRSATSMAYDFFRSALKTR